MRYSFSIALFLSLFLLMAPAVRLDSSDTVLAMTQLQEKNGGEIGYLTVLPLPPEPRQYETIYATVSAYTSEKEQTDDSPEISANNENIWELFQSNEMTCASNVFPFGTILHIENLKHCTVRDRMNKRFDNTFRVDYYYGYDTKRAKQFGVQTLEVAIEKM